MAVQETDSSKSSTLNMSDTKRDVGDSDSALPENTTQGMTEDQYPHGLRLVLLAGASIIAVFLIALDQVSILSLHTDTERMFLTQKILDYRRHSTSKDYRQVPRPQ